MRSRILTSCTAVSLVVLCCAVVLAPVRADPHKYHVAGFVELVKRHGYTAEEHTVLTDDGYVLGLHRISGSPSKPKTAGKEVVYIQHGIFLSSDSWVLMGPKKDLAFILADEGKDVWIGNSRGNTYSQMHVSKRAVDPEFWDFSFHEMGVHDMPAVIDYILLHTGAERLSYYGYSMGTTIGYVLLSTRPEYNDKISAMYSLAPVVLWEHELKKLVALVAAIFDPLKQMISFFRMKNLLPQSKATAFVSEKFCGDDNLVTQPICLSLFSNIGLDTLRFNKTTLPDVLAHFPAGTSDKTVFHYNQNYKMRSFQPYDYGKSGNKRMYGLETPPAYNLTNVRVPVAIWYAKNDDIVNEKDVIGLAKKLPNVVSLKAVRHNRFNHFDFLWATDAKQLVYDHLL